MTVWPWQPATGARPPATWAGLQLPPYVQQALAQGAAGSFYGIGVTTGEPGYFLSQAIRDDDHGHTLGLVVIKIALAGAGTRMAADPDIVLASDAHGVVFLASQDAWRYRLLEPLDDAEERRELNATRQYADQPLRPWKCAWKTHGQRRSTGRVHPT